MNIVISLDVAFDEGLLSKSAALDDSITKIFQCYKTHASIRLTKDYTNKLDKKFAFEKISWRFWWINNKTRNKTRNNKIR